MSLSYELGNPAACRFRMADIVFALVCAGTLLPVFAQDDVARGVMRPIKPADRFAEPTRIVQPKLAGEWAERRAELTVGITGRVDRYGVMQSPKFVPQPGAEPLAAALAEVIADWRFRSPIHATECKTVEREETMHVIYDNREGLKKLEVTRARRGDQAIPALPVTATSRSLTQGIWGYPYPLHAFAARMEGYVELLLEIDPSGRVRNYDVLMERLYGQFAGEAAQMMRRARFQFSGEPPKEPLCEVMAIPYCLSSNVRYPDLACSTTKGAN